MLAVENDVCVVDDAVVLAEASVHDVSAVIDRVDGISVATAAQAVVATSAQQDIAPHTPNHVAAMAAVQIVDAPAADQRVLATDAAQEVASGERRGATSLIACQNYAPRMRARTSIDRPTIAAPLDRRDEPSPPPTTR
jgi:hypothetical protein